MSLQISPRSRSRLRRKRRTFPAPETLDLANRIQALPPELFDLILEYILTLDSPSFVRVNNRSRVPVQLHTNHALRALAASDYYANTTFLITAGESSAATFKTIREWLRSMPVCHQQHIRDVRIEHKPLWFDSIIDRHSAANHLLSLPGVRAKRGRFRGGARRQVDRWLALGIVKTHLLEKDEDGELEEEWKSLETLLKQR